MCAMRAINPFDMLNLQDEYSEEEILIRDSVRSWVKSRYIPLLEEAYEAERFPIEVVNEIAQLGILGATLPSRYGCANVSEVAYGLVNQELEYGDSGLRSFVSVQSALVMFPIFKFGSEEQKDKWLPRLAKAEVIGCFGLTEPDFGSNPAGMITRAQKVEGGYVLNGEKAWITNASIADLAVVWAKDDEGKIRAFLVERGFRGFTTLSYERKLSLRASVTGSLVLQDVFVPEENVLPAAVGLGAALSCLNEARYGIAWGACGSATFCFEVALNYSKQRIQFGKPIGAFQLTQAKLAEMATSIAKMQAINLRIGRLKEKGQALPQMISMAKRNNVRDALEIARSARQVLGANGIMLEYHVMRHLCNLESVITYEGTHEVHTLFLGEALTGFSAFE